MMAKLTMSAWGLHYITGSPPDLKASGTTSLCRGVKDKSAVGKSLTNVTSATVHRPKSALWGFMRWICIVAVRRYICEWGHFPSQGCHRHPTDGSPHKSIMGWGHQSGGWEEGKGTGGVAGVSPWFSKEFCVACICCVCEQHWRCCFLSGVLYQIL